MEHQQTIEHGSTASQKIDRRYWTLTLRPRLLFWGGVLVLVGISVLIGHSGAYPSLAAVWLALAGGAITAVGALMIGWSLTRSILGLAISTATPGAFIWYVALTLDAQLDLGAANAVFFTLMAFGLLWAVFGPLLVIFRARLGQTPGAADSNPEASASTSRDRRNMSRYQMLMVSATVFTGLATIFAVLLARWLE